MLTLPDLELSPEELQQRRELLHVNHRFRTGQRSGKKNRKSQNTGDWKLKLLQRYEQQDFPEVNVFLNYVGKEESTNPFDWWKLQLEEDKDRLKDLSLASYRTLTLQVGSTFSESQFSHSKIITSGCSAKTGVNKSSLVKNLDVQFRAQVILAEEMDDETFEDEELENCDAHSLSALQV